LASAVAIFALGGACAQTSGVVESSCRTTAACRAEADKLLAQPLRGATSPLA
jgi:hypothetical protein